MPNVQVQLSEEEDKKLLILKERFELTSKADTIMRIIRGFINHQKYDIEPENKLTEKEDEEFNT